MSIKQKVRQTVQTRAESRCEYCHIPDMVTSHTYHVDHIIAIKHDGSDELSNLAWSCLHCNRHKGTDIASYDRDTGELTPFFNPRSDVWNEHFELSGVHLRGKTPIGRVTVRILQMNHLEQIDIRNPLIDIGLF
jgi:HNH endonuclease